MNFKNPLPQRLFKKFNDHLDCLLTITEGKLDAEWGISQRLDVPYDREDPMFQPEISCPVLKTESQFLVWTRCAETRAQRPPSSSDLKLYLDPGHPFQEFPDGFLHEA